MLGTSNIIIIVIIIIIILYNVYIYVPPTTRATADLHAGKVHRWTIAIKHPPALRRRLLEGLRETLRRDGDGRAGLCIGMEATRSAAPRTYPRQHECIHHGHGCPFPPPSLAADPPPAPRRPDTDASSDNDGGELASTYPLSLCIVPILTTNDGGHGSDTWSLQSAGQVLYLNLPGHACTPIDVM